MKRKTIIFLIASLFVIQLINAQVYYVDSKKGNDKNIGTLEEPFKDIEKAVSVANNLTGFGSITIKLKPGIYILKDKVCLNPIRVFNDTCFFTIEASIMPNDSNWTPEKMPVIVSYSGNNSTVSFPHSAGLVISKNNVVIKGLKFIGNPNPEVPFYYPIRRPDSLLTNVEISQCFFIGERNSASIQGGIWANGQNININHCVFYNCRNAILLFSNINGCIITNNLIYESYESAIWIGGNDTNFIFKNNVVTKCDFFWTQGKLSTIKYKISDCLITDNIHYCGKYDASKGKLVDLYENILIEKNISKVGSIDLVKRKGPGYPRKYLHLTEKSIGSTLNAGIFIDE